MAVCAKPFLVDEKLAARLDEPVTTSSSTTLSQATAPASSPSVFCQNSPRSSSSHNLHPTQHAPNFRARAPPGWRAAPRPHPRAPPRRRFPVPVSKQTHLVTPSIFFDHFDRALPALKLRSVSAPLNAAPGLQHSLATYPQALTERIINMMLAVFKIRWVFKNTPASSQPSLPPVYGVGCHTRQICLFLLRPQRRTAQKIFKPSKSAKVRLAFRLLMAHWEKTPAKQR